MPQIAHFQVEKWKSSIPPSHTPKCFGSLRHWMHGCIMPPSCITSHDSCIKYACRSDNRCSCRSMHAVCSASSVGCACACVHSRVRSVVLIGPNKQSEVSELPKEIQISFLTTVSYRRPCLCITDTILTTIWEQNQVSRINNAENNGINCGIMRRCFSTGRERAALGDRARTSPGVEPGLGSWGPVGFCAEALWFEQASSHVWGYN